MKHLVSLIDGTWLTPSSIAVNSKRSNIFEINLLLLDGAAHDGNEQIVFYSRGLGAVSGIRKYTAGGFAYGIKEEIEDVYINIASNYVPSEEPGKSDKIYLYGFSRGAVIARVVAGLISNVGLLFPWEIESFGEIWKLYKDGRIFSDGNRPKQCHSSAEIEFLGVFDTVFGGNDSDDAVARRLQFTGKKISTNVKNAVHILAMDEQRPFFRPLLWESDPKHSGLRQIWMPGVHGDIGGCCSDGFLGTMSLLTMIEATQSVTQLAFEEEFLERRRTKIQDDYVCYNVSISNEWSWPWRAICLNRKYVRRGSGMTSDETLHYACRMLADRQTNFRNKSRRRYAVPSVFAGMPMMEIPKRYEFAWDKG